MKFATKFTLYSLSIVLLFATVVFYTVYATNIKILEKQINESLESVGLHTMEKIDRMLFERLADIRIIASDPIISSKDSTLEAITERLSEFRNHYKTYASLSFFDLNLVRIADTAGMDIGERHNEVPWARDVINEGVVSAGRDIRIAEELKTPVIYFAAPVQDKKGNALGAVVARMPVNNLYPIVRNSIEVFPEMHLKVDLVDKDGLILYSNYNRKNILKGYISELEPDIWKYFKNSIQDKNVTSSEDKEGEIDVFAREQGYLDFKGNEWTLIFHVPTYLAFAPAKELKNKFLWIMLPTLFFFILLILFLSRSISRPLTKLKNAALEISKGNLDIKLSVKTQDEIGRVAASFNDMTEALQASRNEIIETKEYTDNIIRSLIGALIVIDPNGKINSVNKAASNLLGYKEEALFNQPATMIFAEEERLLFKGLRMDDFPQEEFTGQVEKTLLAKDGKKIPVLLAGSVMRDKKGEFRGIVLVALDITDRKKAEEKLQKSIQKLHTAQAATLNMMEDAEGARKEAEQTAKALQEGEQRFKFLVSNIPGAIYRCANDPDWTMEFISEAVEEISGYPASDFIDNRVRTYATIIHPDDREMVDEKVQEGVNQKKPYVIHYRVVHAAGEIRWIYEKGQGIFDSQGRFLCLDGAIFDITEHKFLEEKNKMILERAIDGFWVLNPEGRILNVNNAFCEISGYSREELLNKRVSDLEVVETPEETDEHIKKVIETGWDHFESRHRRKDGRVIDVEVSANYMDIAGGRFFSFLRDITERKRTEKIISRLNETFLNLGPNYEKNIQLITQACGELLGAACSLYNRLEEDMLCSLGQWNVPDGYNPKDKPEGHICYDLMRRSKEGGIFIVRNLPETGYFQTDPNVAAYGLKTYIGHPVNWHSQTVGALCAVFLEDARFSENEEMVLGVLAKALENEEERYVDQKELKKAYRELEKTQNASLNIMADLDRQRKELDVSLKEKEVLLREVHHRVKNNMQIISSILKLQSRFADDERYETVFQDSEHRIRSMALVHERLYQTKDFSEIDFQDYVKSLIKDIFRSFGVNTAMVKYRVMVEEIHFNINKAIPCGLIINELVSNSLKYAFPENKKGEIIVAIKKASVASEVEMEISDDGVGLPENLDLEETKTLGLHLVTTLVKQLQGVFTTDREKGTKFRIRFGLGEQP